jgi:hypothetical protein
MATQAQIDQYLEDGSLWITNDPEFNYRRKFTFKLIFDPIEKKISLDGNVTFHKEDGSLVNMVRFKNNYWRSLIADKKPRPDGTTEYDHFVENAREPIQIFNLIINTALWNASQGKFDI